MKEIKQKPAGGKPKTADAARVPKAVVKAAWLQAREAARAGEKQVVGGKDGAYSGAADTGEKGADKLVSTGERVTELAYRGGRKLAERSAGQRRERAKAAQTGGEAAQRHGAGETIAHTSTIEASRPPQTREAGRVSDENRPAGARPQQRESRAVGRAKPIKPGREMKQGAPGPKTTEQAGKARQAVQAAARNGQAKARFTQRAQQTAKRAVDTTKRATDAARAGMRALVEALHSLLIALAAGGSVAVLIVVLICLIAFVAGSAYGIFFAAEAPGEDAFTVQQAVEQLGGEYRDYLQQIESTMPHDRQEIKANDDVYYIRWQDVLAAFSSYVSGAEDGAPVAYLDESRLQQLRQTMWDMNEVAYSTYTETVEIEADEPAGDENTDSGDSSKNPGEDTESGNGTESAAAKTVTQTVLLIELTHKTPDEMAQDYAYTARQQEYLDLLRAPEYETLWAELLGGFLSGGGEILAPAGAWQSTGPLQWPLPITGSICCSSSGQKRGKTMIVVECLYTSNEIEEETILREQQKRCLAAAASYGWAVRREVFEPLQLSARGMDDRTGIQTILDDVCNRRFDLLMIASMDRLSYDKEEVKAFLAEMDLNGISIFNVGSNTVTLASGWDLMAFIRQMISPENGGDAQ